MISNIYGLMLMSIGTSDLTYIIDASFYLSNYISSSIASMNGSH